MSEKHSKKMADNQGGYWMFNVIYYSFKVYIWK
jgi:hypothetical protein